MEPMTQERDGKSPPSLEITVPIVDKIQRAFLDKILSKPGPASDPDWVPGPETISALESSKVLSVRL